jgi:hypothetical protein
MVKIKGLWMTSWPVVLVWILVSILFIGIRSYEEPLTYGPHGRILADNDGSMRWLLVHRALDGEGTRIRWMDEDNAPHGRMNEWTSPLTFIGAWTTWWIQKLRGISFHDALGLTGVWMSAWMGLLLMGVAALYSMKLGGWSLAAVWLLAWQPLPDILQMTRLGNPDYHSFHQVLLAVMFLSTFVAVGRLRGKSRNKREIVLHGVIMGAAAGIAIWSGASECIPLVALIFGLGIYELWILPMARACRGYFSGDSRVAAGSKKSKANQQRPSSGLLDQGGAKTCLFTQVNVEEALFWLVSVRVLAAVVLLAQLYEYWPRVWTTDLELLSPWHVAAAGLAWLCFEFRVRSGRLSAACLPVMVSVGVLILLAGWMKGWRWDALHVAQDPFYWSHWSTAAEMQGWWDRKNGVGLFFHRLWWCYGLSILIFAGLLWRFVKLGRAEAWSACVVAVLFWLSMNQARWGTFFAIVFVLALGLALNQVMRGSRCWHAVGIAVLCFPCWQTVYSGIIQTQSVKGRYTESTIAQLASKIIFEDSGKKGAVVLAPWYLTPRMICHREVRTIASAYWSNIAGLKTSSEIYSTWSDARLRTLLREREVEYFMAAPPALMTKDVIEATYTFTRRRIGTESVKNVAIIEALVKKADYLELMDGVSADWLHFKNAGSGWMIFRVNRSRL